MKQILILAFFIASMMATKISLAQDYDNPVKYMEIIGKQQENVSKRYMSYTSASAHGKREKKVQALRSKLMDEIQEAIGNINSLPSFKNDKSYRDTAVAFMKFYYNVMNDDYSKIINMEELAEQSFDEMEAYILLEEKVQKKMEEANAKMTVAEKAFAAKNNITLTESTSELGGKMKESSAVSKYYHEIYLVFFKPHVQEKNMMDALKKNNMTAMEQSKSAMLKYAQEGLAKLATMKAYNADNGLISACKNQLNFYVKEADKIGAANDYFLSKEKFETLKKEMDKKGDNRTKEDVDTFNKAVNDINKASQTYNNINQTLNEQRNQTLNDWNNAVKTFYDDHTPRYK
jgi:hypothetical protein